MLAVLNARPARSLAGDLFLASALTLLALLVRVGINPVVGDKHQFVGSYVAIACCVWFGSWRTGCWCALLCAVTIELFPPISFVDDKPLHVLAAYAAYVTTSALIVVVLGLLRGRWDDLQLQASRHAEEDRRTASFLALLGHELRNPLATITMAERLIRDGKLDPAALRGTWEMLERQTELVRRLTSDLLDLARVRQGKLTVRMELTNLTVLVEEAIADIRAQLQGRSQKIVHRPAGHDVFVMADRQRMCQVLTNLLHNASKFSPPHSTIHVRVSCAQDLVSLTVQDQGSGIGHGQLERIFEPFVQLPDSGAADHGLGLGLPLTRKLVEMHGGVIKAQSAGPGCGAEFVITMPSVPQDHLALLRGEPAGHDAEPVGGGEAGSASLKLLVVDDNPDAASTLALLLRLKGHEARLAGDGASALRVVQECEPDLVFLDLELPDMNGVDVAMKLRRLAIRQPQIVALTGWASEDVKRRSEAAGFDAHLVKPVSIDDLDRALMLAAGASGRCMNDRTINDRARTCLPIQGQMQAPAHQGG